MTFQTLLANTEYSIILKDAMFLYVQTARNKYIFYTSNHELKCFSLNSFKNISTKSFLEDEYSLSDSHLTGLKQSTSSIELHFEEGRLSYIISYINQLVLLENVDLSTNQHEYSITKFKSLSNVIPYNNWKYSMIDSHLYFIPSNELMIKFNSKNFEHYGVPSYNVFNAVKNELSHLYFINPYTISTYYSNHFPASASTSISFGTPKDTDANNKLVIQSNYKELLEALLTVCNLNNIIYTITTEFITLHFLDYTYPLFSTMYSEEYFDNLTYDKKNFHQLTELIATDLHTGIYPASLGSIKYPKAIIPNTSTYIQTFIESVINKLNLSPDIINISYTPPVKIEVNFDSNTNNLEDLPSTEHYEGDIHV